MKSNPHRATTSLECKWIMEITKNSPRQQSCHTDSCTANLRFSLLGVSVPLWQPILFALCFHTLTNCFSRNPFPFTSIQIPRGCAPQLRDFRSPLPGLSIFRHSHG